MRERAAVFAVRLVPIVQEAPIFQKKNFKFVLANRPFTFID